MSSANMSTRSRRAAPESPVTSSKTVQLAVSPKGVAHVVVEDAILGVRNGGNNNQASPPAITLPRLDFLNDLWDNVSPSRRIKGDTLTECSFFPKLLGPLPGIANELPKMFR
jgi:hypothetical protein